MVNIGLKVILHRRLINEFSDGQNLKFLFLNG